MITKLAVIASAVLLRRNRSVSPTGKVVHLNFIRPRPARRQPLTCAWKPDPVSGRLCCVWTTSSGAEAEDAGPSRRFFVARSLGQPRRMAA